MPKANSTPKPAVNPKPSKVEVPKVEIPVVGDVPTPPPTARKSKKTKCIIETTNPEDTFTTATVDATVAAATTETTVGSVNCVVEGPTCEIQVTENFSSFFQKLQGLTVLINSLKGEFRNLEKKALRELKIAQKVNAKKKRKSGNRSPSGFVKPTLISDELANFLKKPLGSEMARTEVTREINTYIRANNLQDKANGRQINPDESLSALLKVKENEVLTYFNLQRYMSPHFAKSGVKA